MTTYVLTVDVHDLEPTGPVPPSAEVRIWRVVPDASGGQVVSTRQQSIKVGSGIVTVTLTAGVAYWAEFTGVRGWEAPFAFTGTVDTSIAELWRDHQVDPATLTPTAAPEAAWQIELDSLSARVDAIGSQVTTGGQVYTQASPAAQWTITHTIGRLPDVDVYLTSGEHVITDVTASTTQVVVTFPAPTAGYAVLT